MVAYKLIQALFIEHKIDSKEYEKYIEFAAIATIGDVVILIGENRIIAKKGLERINTTFNIGLKSLIKINELDDKKNRKLSYRVYYRTMSECQWKT